MNLKRSFMIFVLSLFTAASAWAQEVEASQIEAPAAYFVELHGLPTAEGGSLADLAVEKEGFRNAARKAGIPLRERFRYNGVWNGFSVEVANDDVPRLARMAEVKAVFPVYEVALPETEPGPEPALATALLQTQANIARSELGLTGRGIRVAVMDTGVDYHHPDLGGCFGPGCKVEVGRDFVGDAFNNPLNPFPVPDSDPDDCNGHGTHVAGIVAANGRIQGVAPEATLGAYRVFGCSGSSLSDVMTAAMDQILIDGADVVNISISSPFQWPEYPTAKAADRLVRKGIVVVASAGNNGVNGLYATGAPAVGEKVIAVASFENTHVNLASFTVSPDGLQLPYLLGLAAVRAPLSGTARLARTGTATSANDACNAVAPAAGSLTGKLALIRLGGCSAHEKARNAQAAGAAGVVLYNNALGFPAIDAAGPAPITVPVVALAGVHGNLLDGRLASGPVDLTWSEQLYSIPSFLAGNISSFSSYGISPTLTLKPDLAAPGATIYSTWPLEAGAFAYQNGTSMASPHVAGAVALLLQARPNTPPAAVLALLQNSAQPQAVPGTAGRLEHVHRQGAGMLRMADAIRSQAKVEPGKLSLGESEAGPAVRTLTVENDGPAVTYTLSHEPALSTAPGTYSPARHPAAATVAFSAPSLTVPSGGAASFDITITAPSTLPDRGLYGGYLVLTPQSGGPALRVPYAGFKGDYQSIPALTPTALGFPWLAKLTPAGGFLNQPDGAAYTLANGDIPGVAIHLDHQVREVRLDVFDADTGKSWHRAYTEEHKSRNSSSGSIFVLNWDGTTRAGHKTYTVPDGRYVIRLTVIKALGDESNPAHVETWTSPVVTIDRP